ncbi:MAG: glycoside hydrolase family 31 protein [Acidimicrobiales bacterium]
MPIEPPPREPSQPAGTDRVLVRAVRDVTRRHEAVYLGLDAVPYAPIGPIAGLITQESPADQGLERRLPNAPDLPTPAPGEREAFPPIRAVLRVAATATDVLRLTLGRCPSSAPLLDGGDATDDGMLVDAQPKELPMGLDEADTFVECSTSMLSLRIRRKPFAFELREAGGSVVARSGGDRRQVAGFPLVPAMALGESMASCSLELVPGEDILGLGEQFGSCVLNGRRLDLAATDAMGVGTGSVYKAVPLYHSTKGYSLFVHTPGPLSVGVGAPYPSVLEVVDERPYLDLFLIGGQLLKDRLSSYTALTGRMPELPRWAFGVWMSRCRYRTRSELEEAVDGMRDHDVPCDVVHIDPDWLERDLLNCDFVWSEAKYPRAKEMIAELNKQGVRVSIWELPYLDPDTDLYREADERDYLVRDSGGNPARVARTFSRDGRPRGLVDFSSPAARRWWKEQQTSLLDLGVSVIKCDFGEGLPDDARMADGRSGRQWRNLYPLWYNRTVFEAIQAARNTPAMVWGRSGWAGSQRYPAQWGGDPEASVSGLANVLRGGLSWSLSAPGVWGHDIGGFYGHGPSPELFIRWAQVGCLSPMARFHGLTPREPWRFGAEALEVIRYFVKLRYRLLPYLLSASGEASRWGWPVLRPLVLEYPHVPGIARIDHEYMLGPDLLVVAVLDDSPGSVDVPVYLPPGRWCDFWTGDLVEGDRHMVLSVPLVRLPLFVRAGAIIPMGPEGRCTDEIDPTEWSLHCWPGSQRETLVLDGTLEHRYRPVGSHADGGPVAVACAESAPRARSAVAHLPGRRRRDLGLRQ